MAEDYLGTSEPEGTEYSDTPSDADSALDGALELLSGAPPEEPSDDSAKVLATPDEALDESVKMHVDADEEAEDASSEAVADADGPESGTEESTATPEDRARKLFASYLESDEPKAKAVPDLDGPSDELEELDMSMLGLADDEDETTEQEAEPDSEDVEEGGRSWFVIHSYSGYEKKVKRNLEHRIESLGVQDKIFEVVVPTEEEIELKDGQRRTVERRIFPGYILVEMLMDEDSWYVVRNTPGVTGFVGSLRRPTPLRKRDVDRILKRMKSETPRVTVRFRPGEKVRICDGPFEDFVGAVDDIFPDKGKVRILVSFFGRETPVELDFLQVEKI
jgi:transcriptional antiterminator NusG